MDFHDIIRLIGNMFWHHLEMFQILS